MKHSEIKSAILASDHIDALAASEYVLRASDTADVVEPAGAVEEYIDAILASLDAGTDEGHTLYRGRRVYAE